MGGVCLLYATFPDDSTAKRIARLLVDAHLAACCNLLPGMHAVYWWEGAVQEGPEVAMLVKTTEALAASAMEAIIREHPYENPAILQLPVRAGAPDYLAWVAATVLPSDSIT